MAVSLGDTWGISRIRLLGQSVLAFEILSMRTGPNVSVYRLDYLFQTVIGVLEVIPLDRVGRINLFLEPLNFADDMVLGGNG